LTVRRQSRIYFYQRVEDDAFHLRALSEKWIGFSEDDVTNTTVKKINKSWSFVQIFDMPVRTTGKSVDTFLAFCL
jgi:hypothetical protein